MSMTIDGTNGVTFPDGTSQAGSTQAVINNTGAVSDLTLQVGQSAYIDISAATSIALHIATGTKQKYRVQLFCSAPSGSNSSTILQINNTSYAGTVGYVYSGQSNGAGIAGIVALNGMPVSLWPPISSEFTVYTDTANKMGVVEIERGINASSQHGLSMGSATSNDTTTAWTSLGTIVSATALTGRVLVTREA